MGTLSGEATLTFSFLPPFSIWIKFKKDKIFFFLSFQSIPLFEGATSYMEVNKLQGLSLFEKARPVTGTE